VATAAQWQRGLPALVASVEAGMRVSDRIGRADPRVAGPSLTTSIVRSISFASIRSFIHDPPTASALVHVAGVDFNAAKVPFAQLKGGDV
jgi:hypothetical protein